LGLLLITAVAGILPGFQGCKEDPEIPEVPFNRLLQSETIESGIFKRSVEYAVLLPENYNISTDSFPVVYLLHGFGDNHSAWFKNGLIKYYSDKYASENGPMIFVMPQGFNSYYVNRYNGNVAYMDFFTTELLPAIDSIYRTRKDKSQRAVMGFSMGGYGALILPVMNPDLFSVSVPLSMSFRTDEQYLAEPDWVFDSQWAPIFGGMGATGSARLTDYFKQFSPFYFFAGGDASGFNELKILIDCGDDEETLSVTNNALHCLMRDNGVKHEYRVRDGAHSWDYWHNSIDEALRFTSYAFRGETYPDRSNAVDVGAPVPAESIQSLQISSTELEASVLLPPGYDAVNGSYPVIYLIYDFVPSKREEQRAGLFSLFYNSMSGSKLTKTLVVEIPADSLAISTETMKGVIDQIDNTYKTRPMKSARMLMGGGKAGALASLIIVSDTLSYASCCLFNAFIPEGTKASGGGIFYYLDEGDEGQAYNSYKILYNDIRDKNIDYEHRVRQGDDSFQSFLDGLSASFTVLKKRLSST